MKRIDIQLTDEQDRLLDLLATTRGMAKAELVREAVDQLLRPAAAGPSADWGREPLLQIAGRFHSNRRDAADPRDDYVTE